MSFDEIATVIDDASRMGVFRFVISGGEPFLRDDLVKILLYALNSKLGRIFVSTNGLLLDIRDLLPLVPFRDRITFKISLDGDTGFHDELRGKTGACNGAKKAILQLVESEFDVHVTTTLMRYNIEFLPQLLEWTVKSGVSKHYLVEVIPVGRAKEDLTIRDGQRKEAINIIERTKLHYNSKKFSVICKIPFAGKSGGGFICTGGIEECGILSDGSVVGCRLMPDLIEGNIRKESLVAIWSDPQRFQKFRHLTVEKLETPCKLCKHGPSCLGGCHAYGHANFGSFYSPDGRCDYAREWSSISYAARNAEGVLLKRENNNPPKTKSSVT